MADSETNEENRLSPVLNSHRVNRKLLQQKKLQRKSSRIKLTERFQSSSTSQNLPKIVNNPSIETNLKGNCSFQTASGTSIKLSDKHLKKYSKLFGDILTPVETIKETISNETELDNLSSSLYSDESDKLFENITIIDNTLQNKPINIISFQTASGKELKLTESAIENARKRFSEEFSTVVESKTDVKIICPRPQTVSNEEFSVQHSCDKTTSLVGFQTASGKELKLTESALNSARKRFSEEFSTVVQSKTDVKIISPRPQTVSSEKFSVQHSCDKTTSLVGFQTASGKELKPTESALNSARKRFSEEFSTVVQSETDVKIISQRPQTVSSEEFSVQRSCEKTTGLAGFQTASGKELKLTESALNSARKKFSEEFSTVVQSEIDVKIISPGLQTVSNEESSVQHSCDKITSLVGFQTASGKRLKLTESALNSARKKFSEELTKIPPSDGVQISGKRSDFGGFQTASGKGLNLSQSAIEAAKKRFNEDFSLDNPDRRNSERLYKISQTNYNKNTDFADFQTASSIDLKSTEYAIEAAKERLSEDFSKCPQIQTASDKDSKLAEFSQEDPVGKIPEEFLHQFNYNEKAGFSGFQTASGKGLQLTELAIETAKKRFNEDLCKLSKVQIIVQDTEIDKNSGENLENCKNLLNTETSLNSPTEFNFPGFYNEEILQSDQYLNNFKLLALNTKDIKRKCDFDSKQPSKIMKLNDSLCENTTENYQKQLNISTELTISQMNRSRKRLGMSIKPKPIQQEKLERAKLRFDDLSPIKTNQCDFFNSTPVKSAMPPRRDLPILFNSTITPIKTEERKYSVSNELSSNIIIQQITGANLDVLASIYKHQRLELENKLKIIIAREEAIKFQNSIKKTPDSFYNQRREGVLLLTKQSSTRIQLKDLKIKSYELLERTPIITPQIAGLIHFRIDSAVVNTKDGALIIPNLQNLVGFTEISIAFKLMPGVESKLIPKFWLENHYKWIVWKLASYENFFEIGQDSLNVENILQQLKYRYDREIDKAERPILRRILEKDDTSQKRMVLCVSNIIKLAEDKFELELTDGWYSVRTVIDEVLCSQISKNKIKIGTKLMMHNAELVNCEGCHPLETPDSVYLKINSNSTRRTLWHCKLGCYHILEPFPISLRSIHVSGGLIGCIKVYIARIYPIRYLEKQGKMRVWRNGRAEERRAQEWENEKLKRIEQIHELVRKDYEKSMSNTIKKSTSFNQDKSDIVGVTCGKTLFEMYENSKDPESFQELLTVEQRNSMIEYQRNFSFIKQQEINNKIKESINKLDICQRDVTAVLKILIVDAIEKNPKGFIFQIWKADDNHLETLKEGSIFRIYNVLPKINGDLSSTSKTRFRIENDNLERFENFQRILIPISQLVNFTSNNKPNFNEFDTVGIIVQLSINQYDQNFWLSDGNNCMIFVKIFENSKNCSLLDNLKCGDIISISNLIYCEKQLDFIDTMANHSTIISKYPQSKHLIDGIDRLNKELLMKDVDKFLVDCKEKVANYLDKFSIVKNSLRSTITDAELIDCNENFLDDSEEESTLTSKITSLDVAMSLIDIDKFT